MPALQVRDFPEDLYEKLKACAEREHRSIAQQTVVAVEQMVQAREGSDAAAGECRAVRTGGCQSAMVPREPLGFDFSTEAERAARIAKRKALFEEIHRFNEEHHVPSVSADEIVRITRESREERANAFFRAIGRGDIADKAEAEEARMWAEEAQA